MASRLEEDLCCPVCHDIFREPVLLPCTHSFCKDCLKRWWGQKQARECPQCKIVSSTASPPVNRVLKNLCETFLLERVQTPSGDLCSLHSEKLRLFCLDHQQPVCVVCRDSEKHTNHRFRPIVEAAQQHKENLQEALEPWKEKLNDCLQEKVKYNQAAEHIHAQAQSTEKEIKKQFKKLHKFLRKEEKTRLSALREEEEQKSQRMKMEMEILRRKITDLSETVRVTEETLRAEDVSFLKNYKAAVERVQQSPQSEDPQLPSGALVDVAKHLGNLSFNIWNKMKDLVSYSPVILDPNSAYPELMVSDDLTSVRRVETQQLPDNPERFDFLHSVLGSEGFTSGTHSWDVEVGDSEKWTLGVIAESFQRKGSGQIGHWRIGYYSGLYAIRSSPNPPIVIPVQKKLQRVRVHLDCDGRTLSFSDPDSEEHIYTFTRVLAEMLFPFINTADELKVLPSKVSVKKQV
ncbi:E3 ubiquitin-protein ligase TRIM39-like [Halichoeres trimaculatus]|uniref:E3 ubiquitin-protein ligase TRIM39-like n=1 Tax=Halichoeres trimaculatus TaxID=147232 RepID=UPI003D9DF176